MAVVVLSNVPVLWRCVDHNDAVSIDGRRRALRASRCDGDEHVVGRVDVVNGDVHDDIPECHHDQHVGEQHYDGYDQHDYDVGRAAKPVSKRRRRQVRAARHTRLHRYPDSYVAVCC